MKVNLVLARRAQGLIPRSIAVSSSLAFILAEMTANLEQLSE